MSGMREKLAQGKLNQYLTELTCSQATGIGGAGDYLKFAHEQGYTEVLTIDWSSSAGDRSSSAGDWSFLVSKDGANWRVLYQTNNYPLSGFTHTFGLHTYKGSPEEVFEVIYDRIERGLDL